MRPQTRKLVRLLADDVNDAIVGALQDGRRMSSGDLATELGLAPKTVYRHLGELQAVELLESENSPPSQGKMGPRTRMYWIADAAIVKFRNAANAFGLAHAERIKEGIEEEMDEDRAKQIRPAEEDSA